MITSDDILRSGQLAGRVQRWHTWPMLRRPLNGEHCARVGIIYVELWGMPRAEVLYHCLTHDHGELAAGDTPYGAKRRVPELAEAVNRAEMMGRTTLGVLPTNLTQVEYDRFKVCDLGEMWETACVEFHMGNRFAECSILSCREAMIDLGHKLDGTTRRVLMPGQALDKINRWMEERTWTAT